MSGRGRARLNANRTIRPGNKGQPNLQGIEKIRFNVSPEARTSETLCKPIEEQNQRLTRGLPPVYERDEKRSLFLAADQWTEAFLSL